ELHCRSNYSFLEGASHADELFAQAKLLGYAALAITDRNSLAGIVRAHVAAREAGVRLIVGAEIVPEDGPPLVLLPVSRAGYGRLSSLITAGRRRIEKGQCRILMSDVAEHSGDLFCCLPLSVETRQRYERRFQPGVSSDLPAGTLAMVRELFGDRCSALAELHCGPRDSERLVRWLEQCRQAGLSAAAANDVHVHVPRRRAL
ncbi:MAG: PHP domain-containing protein, partial [Planctomycetaceae bacterium]